MRAKWKHWNGDPKRWVNERGQMIEKCLSALGEAPDAAFYAVYPNYEAFDAGAHEASGKSFAEARQIAEATA